MAADDPPGSGLAVFRQRCAGCHRDVSYGDMHDMVPAPDDLRLDPEFVCDLDLAALASEPQWLNAGLFAVLLVVALATTAWMVRLVLATPATGDDAA